jgi:hypothetical protein
MPFQVSPGVNVTEIDLTTVIPAVSTTEGAIGGVFRWGPVDKTLLVSSQDDLVNNYGKPTNLNYETWFTAASFLAYGNKLYVSRAFQATGNSVVRTAALTNASTTALISNTSGITATDAVFGAGIQDNTVVSSVNSTAVVLSKTATTTSNNEIQFFDAGYCFNAIANTNNATLASHIIKNEDNYVEANYDDDVQWIAKYPGDMGNSLKISVCDSANAFQSNIVMTSYDAANTAAANIAFSIGSNSATISVSNTALGDANSSDAVVDSIVAALQVGDKIKTGNSEIGYQYMTITSIGAVTKTQTGNSDTGVATSTLTFEDRYGLAEAFSTSTVERYWEYYDVVDAAPGQSTYQTNFGNASAQDELHVVISDEDGKFTGVPKTILEVFSAMSRATDAKNDSGGGNYYKDVMNNGSKYVYWANDRSGAVSNTALLLASSTNVAPYTKSFIGGRDTKAEGSIALARTIAAYDKFKSAEDIDISLVLTGKSRGGTNGEQLANYLIDNIAETRKDCVVFLSPDKADVVNNAAGDEEADCVTFRNSCRSTSYAVLDSGYKYMYDKYNDVYRWIPLNGDIAGLCVRTDEARDAWWSPGGFNRGKIKNIIKLAWNPKKAERDILYKAGVNPVVNFPGEGIILYGDKTLLAKPSAFDRVNVRRLFIVLEKAISRAAKYTLFEFNDEFTRAQFTSLVSPFLRDVQGRRGIYDFHVVCDETNNTGEVIDRNEFIGDIYIKPARSINFIQLNFVAVRTGVEFSEVIGKF